MRKTWFSALSWGLVSRLTVADETRKLPCKSELYFYFLFFIFYFIFFKKRWKCSINYEDLSGIVEFVVEKSCDLILRHIHFWTQNQTETEALIWTQCNASTVEKRVCFRGWILESQMRLLSCSSWKENPSPLCLDDTSFVSFLNLDPTQWNGCRLPRLVWAQEEPYFYVTRQG